LQQMGNRLGAGKPSALNTFFMGAGAGLVASPCTGPILAALLAYTAGSGDVTQGSLLLFTYSLGFALPYVFLGSAAAKISKVKVSPSLQVATKLLFAGVMFALTLYYLRIPAYQLLMYLKPYWAPICLIALTLGLLVSVVFLITPKLRDRKEMLILPAAILGIGIFAASQWMTSVSSGEGTAHVKWYKSEQEAYAAAKSKNRPIFIDAWAEWCEACKKMDASTFVDPDVANELNEHWIPLKLDLTETTDENDRLIDVYGLQSLPTSILMNQEGQNKEALSGYIGPPKMLGHLRQFRGG